MPGPVVNHELGALIAEAGMSHAALARSVNHLGQASHGLRLAYDYRSVGRWLRGANPDPPAPELIAIALSRALGRRVEPRHLGFGQGRQARESLFFPADPGGTVSAVTGLWRDALNRRALLHGGAAVTAALALEAAVDWRFGPPSGTVARETGSVRVTDADVARLHTARRRFQQFDHVHGGGSALTTLTRFLHTEVSPLLTGRYPDPTGRDLFLAAAMLTNTGAWMAMDAGQHGLAQRYYTQAAGLASYAGDTAYGALVVCNLGTQALYLGHARTAIRLTRTARDAGRTAPGALRARIIVTEARAHALVGEGHEAARTLRVAEQAMNRPGAAADWLTGCTPGHFAGSVMHALRDLGRYEEAGKHAAAALDLPPENVRTRALHTVLHASVLAAKGELDGATETARLARTSAGTLKSRRLDERLAEFAARLTPHRTVPVVAEYLGR